MTVSGSRKLLIYGSRDFGHTILSISRDCEWEFSGFIDDIYSGSGIVGNFEAISRHYSPHEFSIALGIGYQNLEARWRVFQKVKAAGYECPRLIHPRSYVESTARIGEGAVIMATCVVDMRTRIGAGAVLWPGAIVNHDSHIGDNVFISPNATVCGFSSVGSNSFIGAGSVIVDHVTLKNNSFIKAGSVIKVPRQV